MGWKILGVVLAIMWISGIPEMFSEPSELRDWIGRAFSGTGIVGLLAYAFGWSIMDERFWLPFALAFAAWLTFGVVSSTVTSWPLFFKDGSANTAGLLVAVGVPIVVSLLQWLPVWRYANGHIVE
jgi:hypothetical protein